MLKWWILILAIKHFLIFAYDIENDRDFMTWIWLLTSLIAFYIFDFMYKNERKNNR